MKFKVDRQEFHKAINKVESIISAREIRSVISNILIEAEGGRAVLTATDLEIGIKTSIEVETSTPGTLTLPAKKLSQAIREFHGASLSIEADADHRVTIVDASGVSKARITIMGAPSDEYPVIPTLPDKKFTVFPPGTVLEMIRKTGYAVAEEDARYVFNGLYMINDGNKVSFVGTDGRRLAKIEREFPETLPFKEGVILPNKAMRELHKLLDSGGEGKVAYEEKDRRVYFRLGGVDLIAKLIEGQFPDYQQVIPSKLENKIQVNRERLEKSVRQVAVMAAEPSRQVRVSFQSGAMNIAASTPDLGEAQDSIETGYSGEEITIAFNSNFMMDVVRVIGTEEVSIGFTSPSSPAVIQEPDDKDFISVIMPMKI